MNRDEEFIQCFRKKSIFMTFIGIYKESYLQLFISAVIFYIKNSPILLMPYILANIVDAIMKNSKESVHSILINVLVVAIVLLLNPPMQIMHVKLYSKALRNIEKRLRQVLLTKMERLSMNYYQKHQSGTLQSKIIRDVEGIQVLSEQFFIGALNSSENILLALIIVVIKSRIVFLFFLVLIPLAVFLVVRFNGVIQNANMSYRKSMEKIASRVSEMMELIPITRAHGLEEKELEKSNIALDELERNGRGVDRINAIFGSMGFTLFEGFQLICLVFTSYLALHHKITVGEVTLFQTYFVLIVNNVIGSIGVIPAVEKGLQSLYSIGEVLLSEEEEDHSGTIKLDPVTGEIHFHEVSYKYPDAKKYALSNFSLDIKPGEQIALVGESGSGKSTLLSLLLGFMNPTDGDISIEGKKLDQLDKYTYRHNIAVVQQNTVLFSGTLKENILYGLDIANEKDIQNAISMAELSSVIKELPDGLDSAVNEHGNNFSGGQKQRISIARAIMRDAKIIILDEATSALDSITEQKVQSNLNKVLKGKTRLVATHRLSTIKEADKIVVLKQGVCVETGTFDELIEKKGEFYSLVNKQRI